MANEVLGISLALWGGLSHLRADRGHGVALRAPRAALGAMARRVVEEAGR